MASTGLMRIIVPFGIGALASAGAIVGSVVGSAIVRDRRAARNELGTPLRFQGWWSSGESSPLAYAHPAVLFIDTSDMSVVDSWDRRTNDRVAKPLPRPRQEWPSDRLIVVDAVTGDLLATLEAQGMTGA